MTNGERFFWWFTGVASFAATHLIMTGDGLQFAVALLMGMAGGVALALALDAWEKRQMKRKWDALLAESPTKQEWLDQIKRDEEGL